MPVEIRQAQSVEDYLLGRALFEEYAKAVGIDLCFQNFGRELETLPQMYGPPRGCMLIAEAGGEQIGCVGLREQAAGTGEIKRLYVRPAGRGTGTGRALTVRLMEQA